MIYKKIIIHFITTTCITITSLLRFTITIFFPHHDNYHHYPSELFAIAFYLILVPVNHFYLVLILVSHVFYPQLKPDDQWYARTHTQRKSYAAYLIFVAVRSENGFVYKSSGKQKSSHRVILQQFVCNCAATRVSVSYSNKWVYVYIDIYANTWTRADTDAQINAHIHK